VGGELQVCALEHAVQTTAQRAWDKLKNGELLKAAEDAGFDVLVTPHKNICYQQNLTVRTIALVVLGTLKTTNKGRNTMTIHLAPEQERRIQTFISRGTYESLEEVVEAALTAVEQRTVTGFAGTPEELDTLLAEGLASKQLAEDEFWGSVGKQTDAMLAEHKTRPRS
jgi:Arc/MetJ-type ribon-helix-helix transcriptional regulator